MKTTEGPMQNDDGPSLAALTHLFAELGAPTPELWARSQIEEGIPQLARFLFLRQAWRRVLEEGDTSWIEPTIAAAAANPDAPFAGVGQALARLRRSGARDEDVSDVVRGMQAALLFAFCRLLGEPGIEEPEVRDVLWTLVQVTPEGDVSAPLLSLHESVLATDPTGREMRPRHAR